MFAAPGDVGKLCEKVNQAMDRENEKFMAEQSSEQDQFEITLVTETACGLRT